MDQHAYRCLFCALIATAMSVSLTANVARGQGVLSQLRDDVRTSSPPKPEPERKREPRRSCGHRYSCDCDDDSGFGSFLGELFGPPILLGVTSPFWGPSAIVDDDFSSAGYFPEYPYKHDIPGHMMIYPYVRTEPFVWSLQARSEYAHNLDEITRIGHRLLFETTTRFGIDAELNYWEEAIAAGVQDNLWTGDGNVVFRIAQSERVQMRTGIGVNWLADNAGSDFGFNFTYRGDFFPRDPWILSTEIDLGSLGDETLFHGRVTGGVQWHRAEIFAGYDYYDVDRTQIGTFVGGLRFWF